ncbi:DUF4934 domain-containing protein [uncultured Parabacteroides sp.]|uniref:6-bladed beta-propeller n=1 Tax=uncultured Parabacteroides sp. TaxID=512312 RepID=UPI0026377368|nr:DUF4934 domain-containing protein [uncultured Parabacteroides sp.]
MSFYRSLLLLVFIFVFNLSFAKDLPVIHISKNRPEIKAKVSMFFDSVHYVPLETTDACLLGLGTMRVNMIGDSLLVWDADNCFLFDSKTGHFIRKIGHKGDDPEAFYKTYDNFYNPYDGLNYFFDYYNSLIKYDLKGNFVGKIKMPMSSNWSSTKCVIPLDSTNFCAFFPNSNGSVSKRIVLFNQYGETVKEYPNYHFVKTDQFVYDANDGLFYRYKNQVYFREKFIDTVYQVNNEQLIPKYRLDFSPYVFPYKDRYRVDVNSVSSPYYIFENDNVIIFDYFREIFRELGVYDKKISKASFFSYENGFEDDLNNFMPFEILVMLESGVCLGILSASDVCEYINKTNIELKGSMKFLESISKEDNPIIVIATLKN